MRSSTITTTPSTRPTTSSTTWSATALSRLATWKTTTRSTKRPPMSTTPTTGSRPKSLDTDGLPGAERETTYGYDRTQETLKEVREDGVLQTRTQYEYDLQGRMAKATVTSYESGVPSRVERSTYEYDAAGIRVSAKVEIDADAGRRFRNHHHDRIPQRPAEPHRLQPGVSRNDHRRDRRGPETRRLHAWPRPAEPDDNHLRRRRAHRDRKRSTTARTATARPASCPTPSARSPR